MRVFNLTVRRERLLQGTLVEAWPTFYAFLEGYFDCPS